MLLNEIYGSDASMNNQDSTVAYEELFHSDVQITPQPEPQRQRRLVKRENQNVNHCGSYNEGCQEFLPGALESAGWGMDSAVIKSTIRENAKYENIHDSQHPLIPLMEQVHVQDNSEDVRIPEVDFLDGLEELRMRDAALIKQEQLEAQSSQHKAGQHTGSNGYWRNDSGCADQSSTSQAQAAANKMEAVKPVRRRILRRRSSERKPFEHVPDFIREELGKVSGVGHFTAAELMCCVLFAHRVSLEPNSYAIIKAKMGNKRSRVSIRRKIEKIVVSETGLNGGLLGLTGDQQTLVLAALWNRLMHLLSNAETYGDPKTQLFASKLRAYANTTTSSTSNSANISNTAKAAVAKTSVAKG